MDILGIDFTSRPSRRKPITCLPCRLEGNELHLDRLEGWIADPSLSDPVPSRDR